MKKHCIERLVSMVLCGALLSTGMPGMASPAPPAPDWVKQIAPGTWAAVSLNTMADVDPARDPEVNPRHPGLAPWSGIGQYAVLDAWNGGAFAAGYGRSGALIICGGGHTDYYGNEVYAFELDSRRWKRLTNPYPTPAFPVADGIWPDGTPSVSHTFEQVDYHRGTNSFVMMKTQYHNTGGKSSPVVAMFSLDNLASPDSNANRDLNKRNWRFSPVHTDNYTNSGGWSAYDSKRDLFWAHGGDGSRAMVSFDPKPDRGNGRFGSFQSYPIRTGFVDLAAAYDPINDMVAVTTFRNSPDVLAVDLARPADGSSGNVKLVQTGSPPTLEESHGWEWSPSRRAFVYYRRGAGVYEFKQEGRNWRTDPWRWTGLTSQDNTIVPADARSTGTQGPFGRFRIVSFDDSEIALVVTRVDGPVYAFKIPPSPVARPQKPQELVAR